MQSDPGSVPVLSQEQQQVVDYRGGHLQVVACAGSGKTEAVAQRVAALVAEGCDPGGIVAFTFTERAAAELKLRIVERVGQRVGEAARDRLTSLYVGTIHGYCLRLVQDFVPAYCDFDIIDPHQQAALVAREFETLGLGALKDLMAWGKWKTITEFTSSMDVVFNELAPMSDMPPGPMRDAWGRFVSMLDRYRVMSFGRVIQLAVDGLADPGIGPAMRARLRHLIVDEYQDINPAQERLISLLGAAPVQVCAVGDDDQAIYQWRGSNVAAALEFTKRFPGARVVALASNRRSVPAIVQCGARIAATIPNRVGKEISAIRPAVPGRDPVVLFGAESAKAEAAAIADAVERHRANGVPYRHMAVLFRSVRRPASPLVEEFRRRGIPYVSGGRSGLFLQPEVDAVARVFTWLTGFNQDHAQDTEATLARDLRAAFGSDTDDGALRAHLLAWRADASIEKFPPPAEVVRRCYDLFRLLGIDRWDFDSPALEARLGGLARFTTILADFEHSKRRARTVDTPEGPRFRGGQDGGVWFYRDLAQFLTHYARHKYEDFEGEDHPDLDAVDVMTVHRAKGLEWPVVFIAAAEDHQFPSARSGEARDWLLPDSVVGAGTKHRYQGSEADERRLFYVAATRARDALYVSHHSDEPSRFLDAFGLQPGALAPGIDVSGIPPVEPAGEGARADEPIVVGFSSLADFGECGFRYRLREVFGFESQLVAELGYGRAVHQVLRRVADVARQRGEVPSTREALAILDETLFLPFANLPAMQAMKRKAESLVTGYVERFSDDLRRVWATERSFELHVDGAIVAGRADVILDREGGREGSLAVVDYKTAGGDDRADRFRLQLRVYSEAGIREGVDVTAAYVHQLEDGSRERIAVEPAQRAEAVQAVQDLADALRARSFTPKPCAETCGRCDFRPLCRHRDQAPAHQR